MTRKILSTLLILCLLPIISCQKASAEVYINPISAFESVGDTFSVKIKGTDKKVKWSVSNKNLKIVKKGKKTVKLKAVKVGSTVVKGKVGGKAYKCSVLIVDEIT